MSENFNIEIISPDKTIVKKSATLVTIPSFEGNMGILKDHISLITFLRPGLINIESDEKKETFFIEEGVVEFFNNNLLILTASAINIQDLDKNKVEDLILLAEKKITKNHIKDKEKYILSHKIDTLKEIRQ
jgi:F-type H+-transporting ATPase subunit epsilon|tara:strand:+ start:516 stop:908 length:393 start_codon:yes stop_codon:yes gene_type:complete